jgi:NTE family protein
VTTAFVLSGGASLGAIEVGMARALMAAGIEPDLLFGTSVGAVNVAYLAGHPGPAGVEGLAELWLELRASDVFPANPLLGFRGFLGRTNYLVSPNALRRIVQDHLTYVRLQDAAVPVYVVATEVGSGEEVVLSEGDAAEAVMASAAIPGVFPPVRVGDRDLMDGGVADNTPISHAVRLGCSTIYVLPTGHTCADVPPPKSALGMVLHAITVMIGQQLVRDVAHYRPEVELHVVPPLCPLAVFPGDFRHTAELIERGDASTRTWLEKERPAASAEGVGRHRH